MIKFIHTADLHLGLRFTNSSFSKSKAIERRGELWSTFEKIVEYTRENSNDFLFIAGDLFEEAYFTMGDIIRVRDILKASDTVKVVISAGNHDYMGKTSLYNKIEWSQNVTIFSGEGIQKVEFQDLNTVIYGYSWDVSQIRENNLFKGLSIDKDKNNILILHGDISNSSSYLPLNLEELKELNMDYIALGHIHKPQIFTNNIAYSGCPEPLDFGEQGERGIIEGEIKDKITDIQFIPFSKRRFLEMDVDMDGSMGYMDIVNKIKSIDIGRRKIDFYRINLKGFINEDIDIEEITRGVSEEFYYLELLNNTVLDYDLERLEKENKDNIIGKFIDKMRDKDIESPIIRDALYMGLEALLKEKN